MFSVIVIYGPELVLRLQHYFTALGGVTGIVTILAARNSMLTRQSAATSQAGGMPDWNARITQWVLRVTAPLSVLMVLVGLAFLSDWLLMQRWPLYPDEHLALIHDTSALALTTFVVLALLIGGVMARFINVNRFSLHAMYRNRLIRAYLGASRPACAEQEKSKLNCRDPHPFTGFDPVDNLSMHELWPSQPTAPDCPRPPPLHVINIALNLVHGKRLAWQQRKAASFTVTALHAGGCCVGYRKVDRYGGVRGMSLGTAMTISGAAASPNMGYQSKSSLSFLMSLFNARLGWWLGNPAYRTPGRMHYSVTPMIDEMLGLTSDDSPWVYLSDGYLQPRLHQWRSAAVG